ncbi:hypothetical protein J7L05_11565 [bacterium]|nr:hypothetical protein [bacterium]
MRFTFLLILTISLLCPVPALADVKGLERAVSDPVDSLIYPQQLVVGNDGTFHILDTVSNSSHIKAYSRTGEFINGLIPAGVGENAARFDLGLTLISGRNIFAVSDDGDLILLDNEDGCSVLKVFDSTGTLSDSKILDYLMDESAYGAVCLDTDKIYVEHEDIIYITSFPFSDKLARFIGKKGDVIDNWDVANNHLIVLANNEIIVFNKNAMPVDSINIAELLDNPAGFDIFDIAVSSNREIALTGEIIDKENLNSPFLATLTHLGKKKTVVKCEQYITSLDYDRIGNLHGLIADPDTMIVNRYDIGLESASSISVGICRPALSHPRRIAIDYDNSIWLDDQYNPDDIINPFTFDGDMTLVLKRFENNEMSEIEIEKLNTNRFASVFLDKIDKYIVLSGVKVDLKGRPIGTPVFFNNVKSGKNELLCFHDTSDIIISTLLKDDKKIFTLDPNDGSLSVKDVQSDNYDNLFETKVVLTNDISIEGIPIIFQIDENIAFIQAAGVTEFGFPSIMHLDIESGETSREWKACDYVDLRLLYACDDSTAVVYWYPHALMRIDKDYNILAWMDMENETAFDLLDGVSKNKNHYLLEGRFNLVYSFDDSAWDILEYCTNNEALAAINEIRSLLSIFYSRKNHFPNKLSDVIGIGLIDDMGMADILKFFMSEDVIYYAGSDFGYKFMVWGKDDDNTLFEVTDKEILEIE